MDEHLQVLVLPHVVPRVLVHRPRIFRTQVHHAQHHRLLVLGNQLGLTRIRLTTHTRWQHIVNRQTGTVFLDIDRLHVDRCTRVHRYTYRRQVAVVLSPVAAHQVQGRETQVRLFVEARHVHSHEADALPVAYGADLLHVRRVAAQRYLELIPGHHLRLAVAQIHFRLFLLHNMLRAHFHHLRTQLDPVLVVFLVLVERVILVDIFDIRLQRRSRSVTLRLLFGRRRVAFRAVEMFVAVQYRHLLLVVVRTSVVMVVIAGRVVNWRVRIPLPRTQHVCIYFRP